MKKIPSQTEKKMIYGIRSLKNGTGSVLIGASIVLLSATMPMVLTIAERIMSSVSKP